MGPGSGGQSTRRGPACTTPLPRKGPDIDSLNCLSLKGDKEGSLCLAEGRPGTCKPSGSGLPHLVGKEGASDYPKVSLTCPISS